MEKRWRRRVRTKCRRNRGMKEVEEDGKDKVKEK